MISQLALILEIVAPVILISAIGFGWARTGAPFDIAFITRLSMNVAGPCLLFSTLVKVEMEPAAFEATALASLATYGLIALGSVLLLAIARQPLQGFLAPLTFGNTGNVGLPVALFAFGEQGLALGLIVFGVMAVLSFTVGVWMVSGDASPLEALKQPIFYGAAAGGAFAYFDWGAPTVVIETMSLMGQSMIPLMLLTLGVSVARLRPSDVVRALWLSVAKAALCAVVAVMAAQAFELPPVTAGVLLIQAVMPVAVTSYLLAERYNASAEAVAGLVVVSTALSLLIAPLTLALVLPGADGTAALAELPRIAPSAETLSAWREQAQTLIDAIFENSSAPR